MNKIYKPFATYVPVVCKQDNLRQITMAACVEWNTIVNKQHASAGGLNREA